MTSPDRPRLKYYLVHAETGQRYPVADADIVIGRSSGDIIFPADEFLAPAQCRIFASPNSGLHVQNLGPMGSVALNEGLIEKNQTADFAVGDELRVGEQVFGLLEVGPARVTKTPKEPKARRPTTTTPPPSSAPAYALVVALTAAALGAFWWFGTGGAGRSRTTAARGARPNLRDADRDLDELFARYRRMGEAHAGGATEGALITELEGELIPRLTNARAQWTALEGANADERAYVGVKRRLIDALIVQTRTMADFYGSHDPATERALSDVTREVADLSAAARELRAKLGTP